MSFLNKKIDFVSKPDTHNFTYIIYCGDLFRLANIVEEIILFLNSEIFWRIYLFGLGNT